MNAELLSSPSEENEEDVSFMVQTYISLWETLSGANRNMARYKLIISCQNGCTCFSCSFGYLTFLGSGAAVSYTLTSGDTLTVQRIDFTFCESEVNGSAIYSTLPHPASITLSSLQFIQCTCLRNTDMQCFSTS